MAREQAARHNDDPGSCSRVCPRQRLHGRSVEHPFSGVLRTDQGSGVSLEEQLRVVWRQRFWLLGLSLLAAILVFVAASLRTTTYSTSAVIGTTPGPVIAGNAVANDSVAF